MSIGTVAKVDDAFAKMQGSLSRYARSNDRRMVLRTMREVKYLSCIPLDPFPTLSSTPIQELEGEVSTENSLILNDIPFQGSHHFLTILKELCTKLCETDGVRIHPDHLYRQLLLRVARSTASADAYFKLNALMGSSDLMLMPTTQKVLEPTRVNLFASGGSVHATVSATNPYGLFRKADVKPADIGKGSLGGRPWITLQAVVDERVNLSSQKSVRNVRVKLPDSLY